MVLGLKRQGTYETIWEQFIKQQWAVNNCSGLWVNQALSWIRWYVDCRIVQYPKLWLRGINLIHLWTILIPLSRFLFVVIPIANALHLSTHVKSNVMRFKPTFFSQNTHAYGTCTSRTRILTTVHLKTQRQLSWKTKFHLHKQWDYYSEIKAMADSVSGSTKHFLTTPCYRPNSGQVGDKNASGNLTAPRSIWNSAQAGCMQVAWLLPWEL